MRRYECHEQPKQMISAFSLTRTLSQLVRTRRSSRECIPVIVRLRECTPHRAGEPEKLQRLESGHTARRVPAESVCNQSASLSVSHF